MKIDMTSTAETVRSAWNMLCPSCKADDALEISATVQVRLCANGTDADTSMHGGHEWTDASPACCADCGWTGTVKDAQAACEANPDKVRDRCSFTHVEVDAALCAWEHLLDQSDNPLYAPYFEALGYSAMRACSVQAGLLADAVYQQMQAEGYEFAAPFDWEFIPAVLTRLDWKALTEDNQFNGAPYRPDIEALFDALLEAAPDNFHKRDLAAEWTAAAKRECVEQWGYAELLDDHPERTEAARDAKQNPAEFVRLLGEKYDLTPKDEW